MTRKERIENINAYCKKYDLSKRQLSDHLDVNPHTLINGLCRGTLKEESIFKVEQFIANHHEELIKNTKFIKEAV